ncbi:unnamed protein product [Closterium sp. NIES-54]
MDHLRSSMNARDVIFYERLNLAQFCEDETQTASTPMTGTTTPRPRTKLLQPSWNRTPEASSLEEIATAVTMTMKTPQEEESADQAEAAEARHRHHHLNQRVTTMTCMRSSPSTATTAPSQGCNS